jgi:hypothetical protein
MKTSSDEGNTAADTVALRRQNRHGSATPRKFPA